MKQIAFTVLLTLISSLNAATQYSETLAFETDGDLGGFASNTDYTVSNGTLNPPESQLSYLTFSKTATAEIGSQQSLSVDFYFDPSGMNPNADRETITLRFIAYSATMTCNVDMINNGLGQVSVTPPDQNEGIELEAGWHRVVFILDFVGGSFGDQVDISAEVYRMNGQNLISEGVVTNTVYDIDLATSETFTLQLASTVWGGSSKLDNFSVSILTSDIISEPHPDFETSIETAIKLSWQSRSESSYRIEYSNSLEQEDWSILQSGIQGTGGRLDFFDGEGAEKRFYRIVEE